MTSDTPAAELDHILGTGAVRSVYQPIVELSTRETVAYEALARGPQGSALERPDLLFAAAREAGRLSELDWACRTAAVQGALDGGLRPPLSLFINVEPAMLGDTVPDEARPLFERALDELDVVLELTERALTDRPADVLAVVDRLRERGWAIALDDVGADPRSLALMPFVRPEVIKLDLRLVQQQAGSDVAAIVHAVNAAAERSGAIILAEGIETEEHLLIAQALGATHGQGWLFGRPEPLPAPGPAREGGRFAPPTAARMIAEGPTPYEVVRARHVPRRGSKRLLLAISRHLETHAEANAESTVLLATFQEAEHFTPKTAARYARMAENAGFVGALGAGMSNEPVPGVRGAALDIGEPLRGEWNVVVVSPHFAAAFVALDLGDDGADMERRFDFCLTYDRTLVVRAAEAMMARVAPRQA